MGGEATAGERRSGFDTVVKLGDLLSKLALVAGGAFAIFQYLEARHDTRVERTTAYIQRYEEGGVGVARREIAGELRPFVEQFNRLADQGGVSAADRSDMVFALLDESPDGKLAANLDIMIDFYDGLWTCVRENLCDRDVAMAYFGTAEAPQLWSNFEPYIAERRRNSATFAVGLEQFIQQ